MFMLLQSNFCPRVVLLVKHAVEVAAHIVRGNLAYCRSGL